MRQIKKVFIVSVYQGTRDILRVAVVGVLPDVRIQTCDSYKQAHKRLLQPRVSCALLLMDDATPGAETFVREVRLREQNPSMPVIVYGYGTTWDQVPQVAVVSPGLAPFEGEGSLHEEVRRLYPSVRLAAV